MHVYTQQGGKALKFRPWGYTKSERAREKKRKRQRSCLLLQLEDLQVDNLQVDKYHSFFLIN